MALKQINIFVENKPGSLIPVTAALAEEGIDIRALSIADTEEFGILRLIVTDTDGAKEALEKIGCLVKISEVVGVKIGDAPGKLSGAVKVLGEAKIEIEYLYAFLARTERHAYVVLRVADNDAAERVLTEAGYHLIRDCDIAKL